MAEPGFWDDPDRANGLIRERVESRYLLMIEDTLANEVGSPVRGNLQVNEPSPAARSGCS